MHKKISILFLLFFYSFIANTQDYYENVTVSFGKLNLEKGKNTEIINAFKVDEGYIVFKKEPIRGPGGWSYFIEKFDDNLKSLKVVDVSLQFEENDYIIKKILKIGDSYVLFSIKTFKKEKKESLFVQTFDWSSNELSDPKKLYTLENISKKIRLKFAARKSSNERFLMYEVYSKNKEGIFQTSYTSIDTDFDQIWNIDNVVFEKNKNEIFFEKSAIVGNNGDVYVLGKRTKKEGRKIISSNYELSRLNEDGIEVLNLENDDFIIKDVILAQSTGNTLILSGYYHNAKNLSAVKGVYTITIDSESLEVIDNTKNDFTFEFISANWSKKSIEKTKKKDEVDESGITSLDIKKIINHNDGSISLIGEKFWTTTHTITNSDGSTSTSTTLHWGNLIITRISQEGEIISHSRYIKHSTRDNAFEIFAVDDNIFVVMLTKKIFFYYDDIKGMSKAERAKYKGWYFTVSKITPDGESEKYILLDYTKPEYEKFRRYEQIGDNSAIIQNKDAVELLVVTYKGSKKFALARFSFKKE